MHLHSAAEEHTARNAENGDGEFAQRGSGGADAVNLHPVFSHQHDCHAVHANDRCQNNRRLATDHSSLHAAGLPPNYLFPPSSSGSDDLTQLNVLLAGPQGTPYANGLWRLQLKIPTDYPRIPPKALFRTRIWHPNIEEKTGGVCVDTLKNGWGEGLTLRDVLVVSRDIELQLRV